MLTKIFLIVIFFSVDGQGYRDFIGSYDTQVECESAKLDLLKMWESNDPSGYYFGVCTKARPVKSVDV